MNLTITTGNNLPESTSVLLVEAEFNDIQLSGATLHNIIEVSTFNNDEMVEYTALDNLVGDAITFNLLNSPENIIISRVIPKEVDGNKIVTLDYNSLTDGERAIFSSFFITLKNKIQSTID